jgi:hypothetical protein
MMKSIKTNTNSAKGPNKGKIVNKLYCILLTTRVYAKTTQEDSAIFVQKLKKDVKPTESYLYV